MVLVLIFVLPGLLIKENNCLKAAKAQILNYLKTDPNLQQNSKLLTYTLVFVKDQVLVEKVEF